VFEELAEKRRIEIFDLRSGSSKVVCPVVLLQNAEAGGSNRDIPLWYGDSPVSAEANDQ
jgi:hypothetical protein